MEKRFYIIPHDDQWVPEREGELPTEVTVIDRNTNCTVKFAGDIWLECLPYEIGIHMVEHMNWIEEQRTRE